MHPRPNKPHIKIVRGHWDLVGKWRYLVIVAETRERTDWLNQNAEWFCQRKNRLDGREPGWW